ncbi:CDP-glycerol glycerophosphotransferase family protein [Dellaglioa sp. L3N]
MQHKFKGILQEIIKRVGRQVLILLNDFMTIFSVKKQQVIFESFNGRDINDNPMAIYKQVRADFGEENAKRLYFSVKPGLYNSLKKQYPEINLIKRFGFGWTIKMARAEFWVFNSRLPIWWKKNSNTTYIQTWHGTPLKHLGMDIENVAMPGTTTELYHANFTAETARWDYLIAPNQYSKDIFESAFAFNNKSLDIGYPRNDILYADNNEKNIKALKKAYLGNEDAKVVLYAPTWRDDSFFRQGVYKFNLAFSFEEFFKHVSDDTILIMRPHYLVKNGIDVTGFEDRVKIMADENITELYLMSDMLITDYSSVMFDYANLNRPMLFYCYDLDHYRDELRGFYIDFEAEAPGPVVVEEADFYKQLAVYTKNDNYPGYEKRFKDFQAKFIEWDDGQASKKVSDIILGK